VRVLEAATVNRAARRAVASADGSAAAVILAGDFNLVGSETPLITAGRGLDTGGGDLEPIYALQLDGASTATWIGPSTPFPPGQLDYLLHPSSLEPLRAFVFETEDLGVADLATLGLSAELSDDASDHRPVVADFRWR
jgi:endonuclease/exonuclease/phosphatase family metal-dependent hydrolase